MEATYKKKVLITGVAGFIGFHLADNMLRSGHTVVGIDVLTTYYDPKIKKRRLAELMKHPKFTFAKIDLKKFKPTYDFVKNSDVDEIVHLAAQAGVRFSVTDPWTYIHNNEIVTLNILETARRLGLKRVVYASSSSVYGLNKERPMREDQQTRLPASVYGATKAANELLAHVYHHQYGLETIGLRFFTVYGRWSRPDMALFKFTKKILQNKPIDIYNKGKMRRSFTHIDDVVEGILSVLKRQPKGLSKLYNLGGGQSVSLSKFVSLIEKELATTAKKNLLPMQAGDIKDTMADCNQAKKELGYSPKKSVEEGVADFVKWFKEEESFLLSLKDFSDSKTL